jgi:uncharacterized membrane protein
MRRCGANMVFFCRRKLQKSIALKMLRGKRIPLYQVPLATVKVTLHAIKWISILVLLYLTLGFIVLLVQDGMQSVRDIIIYGIMGFVTFFMGYAGWWFARDIIQVVKERKAHNEDLEV